MSIKTKLVFETPILIFKQQNFDTKKWLFKGVVILSKVLNRGSFKTKIIVEPQKLPDEIKAIWSHKNTFSHQNA